MNLLMKTSRSAVVSARDASCNAVSLPAAFAEQLSDLYALVEYSPHLFASPLGSIETRDRLFHFPRFVYFGPDASEAAVRLSLSAGIDHRDLRSTLALLHLVEDLSREPNLGQGLNLSIFPLVDLLGLAHIRSDRRLVAENWASSETPEIVLLERDARLRAYHGFIRLESVYDDDAVTIRLRAAAPEENLAPPVEFISSLDFELPAVRWETDATPLEYGPLSVADDLPLRPFELTIRIPASWSLDRYENTAGLILRGFVQRFRAFFTYGQHL